MDSILYLVVAVLGLSALIIIHEFGHFIVARAFGMRARVFSIGFGPTVAQWRPKGGETVYQVAAIPVLAYVNIAGMDPRQRLGRGPGGLAARQSGEGGRLQRLQNGPQPLRRLRVARRRHMVETGEMREKRRRHGQTIVRRARRRHVEDVKTRP